MKTRVFWTQRLGSESGDASWMLPYGDLMSLLLAMFVMIAAMSELGSVRRFGEFREAVRSAFGFDLDPAPADVGLTGRPLTVADRLKRAGLTPSGPIPAASTEGDPLACCEVSTAPDRVTIRLADPAPFERFSAVLKPPAARAVDRIADFLAGGEARVEIKGYHGDGLLPPASSFRDGLDLSYARARAVVEGLSRAGVDRARLTVTARADQAPSGDRRIEIIVHAASAASHDKVIAEKQGWADG